MSEMPSSQLERRSMCVGRCVYLWGMRVGRGVAKAIITAWHRASHLHINRH